MLYKPSGAEQEPLKALAPQSVGAPANGDQHHNSKGTFQAEAAPARRDQAAGSAPGQQLSARGSDLQGGAGTGLLAGASVAGALALLLVVAAALNLLRRRSCRSAEHARPNSAEHAKPALGFPDAFLPPAAQDSIQQHNVWPRPTQPPQAVLMRHCHWKVRRRWRRRCTRSPHRCRRRSRNGCSCR